MVAMTVALYKVDDCGDQLAQVLAMAGHWSHCEIAGVRRRIYVQDVEEIHGGWVQFTVDITAELTNHVLGATTVADMAYPVMIADPAELPEVLFHVVAPDAPAAPPGMFPVPPDVVTPDCPLCGALGMMVSSVQAVCGDDRCAMFLWDVTKPRELLLASPAELKLEQNSLDPESESP